MQIYIFGYFIFISNVMGFLSFVCLARRLLAKGGAQDKDVEISDVKMVSEALKQTTGTTGNGIHFDLITGEKTAIEMTPDSSEFSACSIPASIESAHQTDIATPDQSSELPRATSSYSTEPVGVSPGQPGNLYIFGYFIFISNVMGFLSFVCLARRLLAQGNAQGKDVIMSYDDFKSVFGALKGKEIEEGDGINFDFIAGKIFFFSSFLNQNRFFI